MLLDRIHILFASAIDLKTQKLENEWMTIEVAYISSLIDEDKVKGFITVPFTKYEIPYLDQLATIADYHEVTDPAQWSELLLTGFVLIEAGGKIYSLFAAKIIANSNAQTQVESAIQGPQLALSESLDLSMNLIRSMYPSPDLTTELHTIGSLSKTPTLLVFDQRRVDPTVLNEVRERIRSIETEMLQAAGEVEKILTGRKRLLFPTMLITERPDRITRAISQGKIALLIKGSMFAIILPATFFDFMHAVEDNYESYWMTRFLLVVRYIGTVLTITLPAFYIAVVSYNPELFRVQLAFSIAGSRAAVPYPSFIEVFIMLFMIETLIEASTRLPRYIGSTATTVGGLILGQAAQQAGLVSSIMIIVTSVVAISNFVVPVNSLSFAIRFLKYPLIILAIFFGITGIAVGVFGYLVYLCSLRSFGKAYFRVFGHIQSPEGDIGQVRIE
ncbi:spore germination protein [Paenibacillus sp. GCM10023252]|uniref:spore germination protein n=1 Tax=Paenibacillus sp. GCM10023252 TaxID=3252649 RepID=UPI00360E891E